MCIFCKGREDVLVCTGGQGAGRQITEGDVERFSLVGVLASAAVAIAIACAAGIRALIAKAKAR